MTEKESLKDLLNQEAATETVVPSRDMEEEAAAAALDTDNLDELIKAAAAFGWAKKARDIVGIDLHEVSSVADYFLIMSGSNKPQLKAISDNIEEKLAEQGLRPLRIEGYREAEWILLDYGSLVVHIFVDEQRDYYNLERLWGDAPAYKFEPVK